MNELLFANPHLSLGLEITLASLLLFGLAHLVCKLMRRAGARLRHDVWIATFGIALLLPVVVPLVPTWGPLAATKLSTATSTERTRETTTRDGGTSWPTVASRGDGSIAVDSMAASISPAIEATSEHQRSRPRSRSDRTSTASSVAVRPEDTSTSSTISWAWLAWGLAALWMIGVVIRMTRIVVGIIHVRRIVCDSRPLPSDVLRRTRAAATELGLERVRVRASRHVTTPATVGTLRPVVLVPVALQDRLAPAVLDSLVCHELVHVARRDTAMQSLALLVRMLLWHNPLVHTAARALENERETLTDGEVVARSTSVADYAEGIVQVVRHQTAKPMMPVVGVGGGSGDVRSRLDRIVGDGAASRDWQHPKTLRRVATAACFLVAAVTIMGAGRLPRVDVAGESVDDEPLLVVIGVPKPAKGSSQRVVAAGKVIESRRLEAFLEPYGVRAARYRDQDDATRSTTRVLLQADPTADIAAVARVVGVCGKKSIGIDKIDLALAGHPGRKMTMWPFAGDRELDRFAIVVEIATDRLTFRQPMPAGEEGARSAVRIAWPFAWSFRDRRGFDEILARELRPRLAPWDDVAAKKRPRVALGVPSSTRVDRVSRVLEILSEAGLKGDIHLMQEIGFSDVIEEDVTELEQPEIIDPIEEEGIEVEDEPEERPEDESDFESGIDDLRFDEDGVIDPRKLSGRNRRRSSSARTEVVEVEPRAITVGPITMQDARNARRAAVEWLVRKQNAAGSWGAKTGREGRLAVGRTALALLALFETSERVDGRDEAIAKGLAWLRKQQDAEGCFGGMAHLYRNYSHAYATKALLTAYSVRESQDDRRRIRRAIDAIVQRQNPYRGWRYGKQPGDNDWSVTGLMLLVLLDARAAGFDVSHLSLEWGVALMDELTDKETGRTGYTKRGEFPVRSVKNFDRFPPSESESLTALALRVRARLVKVAPELLPKNDVTERSLALALALLATKPPRWDVARGSIDMYYWYHGTHATSYFDVGHRTEWNRRLLRALIYNQAHKGPDRGSWSPIGAWGSLGGRTYSTSVLLSALEVAMADRDALGSNKSASEVEPKRRRRR